MHKTSMAKFAFYRKGGKTIAFNVGGEKFEVATANLKSVPDSRLGKISLAESHSEISDLCDFYSEGNNELYFSRHSRYL